MDMKFKNAAEFGKIIRSIRKQQNFTQEKVAAACGTGIRFIRELEQGKPSCQLEKSLYVAQMLGIKFESILPPPMLSSERHK